MKREAVLCFSAYKRRTKCLLIMKWRGNKSVAMLRIGRNDAMREIADISSARRGDIEIGRKYLYKAPPRASVISYSYYLLKRVKHYT